MDPDVPSSAPSPDAKPSQPYQTPAGLILSQRLTRLVGGQTVFLLILSALVGLGGGYGAILFRELIIAVNDLVYPGGVSLAALYDLPWWVVVAVPAAGGAVVGPLIYFFAREAKGHGVPEVIDAVANLRGRIRPRVALVKTLASAVSIGVGGAVGREGPIVQIGSSLGSTLAQWLHLDARNVRLMVGCGASAGIAATFNAPIAGAIFAIEVILGIGTISSFTPLVVASVVATAVSRYHLGNFPAFEVPSYELVSGWELGFYLVLGGISAFVGVGFSRGLYRVEDLWDKIPVHDAVKPILGGAAVGVIALGFPHVMGVGYETIGMALDSHVELGLILLLGLALAKIVATHLSIGAGLSGGIFAPSLFIGAMVGGVFGIVVNALMPEGLVAPSGAYALVGMGAVVAATTHAPLTVILIVFEMTGDYRIILPLMLACFISSILSVRLSRESIYTLKLVRRGTRIGHASRDDVMLATSVEAVLRPADPTIRPAAHFSEVLERVLEAGSEPVYVAESDGLLRGVINLEDVSAIIRDEEVLRDVLLAADMMRPVVGAVRPDDSLARCLRRLSRQGFEELAVVDGSGRLVGSISRSSVLGIYDREVLRRDAESMRFVAEEEVGGGPAAVLQVPSGERVESIPVTGESAGMTLRQLNLRARYDVHVLGLRHGGHDETRVPDPGERLVEGDVLVVTGPPERILEVRRLMGPNA